LPAPGPWAPFKRSHQPCPCCSSSSGCPPMLSCSLSCLPRDLCCPFELAPPPLARVCSWTRSTCFLWRVLRLCGLWRLRYSIQRVHYSLTNPRRSGVPFARVCRITSLRRLGCLAFESHAETDVSRTMTTILARWLHGSSSLIEPPGVPFGSVDFLRLATSSACRGRVVFVSDQSPGSMFFHLLPCWCVVLSFPSVSSSFLASNLRMYPYICARLRGGVRGIP